MFSRRLALAGLSSLALAPALRAFPDRPLRLIVPFAPGGSTDVAARFLAEALGPLVGQSVIVENRAGANGAVASEAVIRSEADGHVFLVASASTHEADLRDGSGNSDAAAKVGTRLAERAKAAGIEAVVFDRGGNLYHGRIKALADAAREGGLEF